jgi:hypothetical protein
MSGFGWDDMVDGDLAKYQKLRSHAGTPIDPLKENRSAAIVVPLTRPNLPY